MLLSKENFYSSKIDCIWIYFCLTNEVFLLEKIGSIKTKNLLRGLQDRTLTSALDKTLDHLRVVSDARDIKIVNDLLLENPLYNHLDLPPEFPETPPNIDRFRRLSEMSLEKQISVCLSRIHANEGKLIKLVSEFGKLNNEICHKEFDKAVKRISEIIEKFGYSTWLLRKIVFLFSHLENETANKEKMKALLNIAGLEDKNLFALGLVDVMGKTYMFNAIRKNLLSACHPTLPSSRFLADLVESIFFPTPASSKRSTSLLQTQAQASLVDAALFVYMYSETLTILPNQTSGEILSGICLFLQGPLGKEFRKLSSQEIPGNDFYSNTDLHSDFDFYRQSSAWLENSRVTRYRAAVDPFFCDQKNSIKFQSEITDLQSKKYFQDVKSITQLSELTDTYDINVDKFNVKSAGVFSRSVAFLFALGNSDINQQIDGESFLKIMDGTRDIGQLANPNFLKQLLREGDNSKILQFVIALLVMEQTNLNSESHKVRRILQDIVQQDFCADIIKFLDFLETRAEAVATRLFEVCDESFLSNLFFLIPEPDQVFEVRAKILDWQASRSGESLYADRAKTLRLDQKIQKVKGDLDDTRIFVDTFRLKQWIENYQLEELSSIFLEELGKDGIEGLERPENFVHRRLPEVRLALVLAETYKEFCSNRKFGIASFLGRRVRHGTIQGVLLSQLSLIPKEPRFSALMANSEVSAFVNKWLSDFEHNVDVLSKEFLQIRSTAKKKGVFDTDIFGNEKIKLTRFAVRDVINSFEKHQNLHVLENLIQSHCWRFIDVDLKKVRDRAAFDRTKWGMIDISKLAGKAPLEFREIARELGREINKNTDSKFKTLSSWFKEPVNLSPTAPVTLLFNVVVTEIREQFPNYEPKIEHEGLSEITLHGETYHLVYDGMKTAIENAAKHGRPDGKLIRNLSTVRTSNDTITLKVGISTEIRKDETASEVQKKISEVMSGDTTDAMDVEGKSGFRKLLSLKEGVRELVDVSAQANGDMVDLTCTYTLVG